MLPFSEDLGRLSPGPSGSNEGGDPYSRERHHDDERRANAGVERRVQRRWRRARRQDSLLAYRLESQSRVYFPYHV